MKNIGGGEERKNKGLNMSKILSMHDTSNVLSEWNTGVIDRR